MNYSTQAPSPSPGGRPAGGYNPAGIGVIVVAVALAFLATMWIRRAAARYRKRIHEEDE
jgi:hypothetical protein